LGITQVPDPTSAIAIAITSQAALQAAIAHHGTVPNNLNLVFTLVNISPQQLIAIIANIPPTIDAPTFADPMGEFFRILELEFPIKNFENFCNLPPSFGRRMKPSKCST